MPECNECMLRNLDFILWIMGVLWYISRGRMIYEECSNLIRSWYHKKKMPVENDIREN